MSQMYHIYPIYDNRKLIGTYTLNRMLLRIRKTYMFGFVRPLCQKIFHYSLPYPLFSQMEFGTLKQQTECIRRWQPDPKCWNENTLNWSLSSYHSVLPHSTLQFLVDVSQFILASPQQHAQAKNHVNRSQLLPLNLELRWRSRCWYVIKEVTQNILICHTRLMYSGM